MTLMSFFTHIFLFRLRLSCEHGADEQQGQQTHPKAIHGIPCIVKYSFVISYIICHIDIFVK